MEFIMDNNKNKEQFKNGKPQYCNKCGVSLSYDEVSICTACDLEDASNDLSNELNSHLDGCRSTIYKYD